MTRTIELTDEEETVLAEVLRRGAFPNELAIIKLGIYKVSTHFDIPMSDDCLSIPYNAKMRPLLDEARREAARTERRPLFDGLDDKVS